MINGKSINIPLFLCLIFITTSIITTSVILQLLLTLSSKQIIIVHFTANMPLSNRDIDYYLVELNWLNGIPPGVTRYFFVRSISTQYVHPNQDALDIALQRIENPPPPIGRNLEHYVATWATTFLTEFFKIPGFLMTPEQKDKNSGKIPDLVLEKVERNRDNPACFDTFLKLVGEFKKSGGAKIMEILGQIASSVTETLTIQGDSEDKFETWSFAMSGKYIGIFEYHSDADNLSEENVVHVEGYVSITHPYALEDHDTHVKHIFPAPYRVPNDLLCFKDLITSANWKVTGGDYASFRQASMHYPVPCIFNIRNPEHYNCLCYIMEYVRDNNVRPSFLQYQDRV